MRPAALLVVVLLCAAMDGGLSGAIDGGVTVRADDPPPDKYETAVFVEGDLAGAILLASKRLLGPETRGARCLDQLRSYNVHASREGDTITVVFLPNNRCGEGIKGGGGRVTVSASTFTVLSVRGYD